MARNDASVSPSLGGSGTANFIPIWTSSTDLGNSKLFQAGSDIGLSTTSPAWALDVSGHINASLGYKISADTVLVTPGGSASGNVGAGHNALVSPTGTANTAVGDSALDTNTSGSSNTALGFGTLGANTVGSYTTGIGNLSFQSAAGNYNTGVGGVATAKIVSNSARYNTGVGGFALQVLEAGTENTAFGYFTLNFVDNSGDNIGIRNLGGYNLGTEAGNIDIGNQGSSNDNGLIRIGAGGIHNSFFAAGVGGVTTGLSGAVPLLIDTNGQLGTISSSRRFKEDIHDMGDASRDLMRLRPVTFRYKKPFADGSQPMQYGLIAEEVAEIYPDMVAYSPDGQIETVKYQMLAPMLLNEVQRDQSDIRNLQEQLSQTEDMLARLSHAPKRP